MGQVGLTPTPASEPGLTREELASSLRDALIDQSDINAMSLGGSDAFGAADSLSDLDIQLDVVDGRTDEVFAFVEGALEAISPIELRYAIPDPTWHGHRQRFYRLRDTDPLVLVDLVLMERGTSAPRLDERQMHGTPVILFDKLGVITASELDFEANEQRMANRFASLRARFELFGGFAAKELKRGRPIDAWHFYGSMLIQPLVMLLRMEYCPERFEFSTRYLDRDLPVELVSRVRALLFFANETSFAEQVAEAHRWVGELIAQRVAR